VTKKKGAKIGVLKKQAAKKQQWKEMRQTRVVFDPPQALLHQL